MQVEDTIVAPATPVAEAAIAVVRLSGPLARTLALEFAGGSPPLPRRVWHAGYRTRNGAVLDDALFCYFQAPASYTGEDVLEISCHGNPLIVNRVVRDCLGRGCRLAEAGEFTKRAFLNGKMDLTGAEAVADVIRARSDRALEAAHRQLRGDLGRRVEALVDRVLVVCAGVEAYIDFPEEDLPAEERAERIRNVDAVLREVDRLRAGRRRLQLVQEGARVVLLGEPNVGKSSVMNRFAGYERAIVSAEPGTTRDFLEEGVLVGPHRIRMIDTAGLRDCAPGVEREGVRRALAQVGQADVFLLVADAAAPFPTLPDGLAGRLAPGNCLVVRNKIDLVAGGRPDCWPPEPLAPVDVSALYGTGFEALHERLVGLLDVMTGISADEGDALVNLRHAAALDACAERLRDARELLERAAELELTAAEMRRAVEALGEIVGRIDNEAMLDRLFAGFCIGK